MYSTVLALHSLVRWFVLTSLLFSIFLAYKGWFTKKKFSRFDYSIRHQTATIAHIQLILGLWLYFISPVIDYFLHHYKDAVHERETRFFGMEHSVMMLIAIIIITIGSAKQSASYQIKRNSKQWQFNLMLSFKLLSFLILPAVASFIASSVLSLYN